MKISIKKWALCLAALMVMSNVFAADADTPDGFSSPTWYEFRDQSLSIEGKGSFDNPIIVFTFSVMKLLPDSSAFAKLTNYTGSGGNITVPGTLEDGTPITEIGPCVFTNTQGSISSIDMTEMGNLEAFDSDRDKSDLPLSNLSEYTLVYLPEGKAAPRTNVILGDLCSNLQLSSNWDFYAPYDFYAQSAICARNFSAIDNGDGTWTSKAYSVCLPFTTILEQCVDNLDDVSLYVLYRVDRKNKEFVFTNDDSKHLAAGHPYVLVVHKGAFKLKGNANDSRFFFDDDAIDVAAEPSEEHIVTIVADGQEVGTLPTDLFDSDGDMSGYDDETTGVALIDNGQLIMDNEAGAWYDLQGRRISVSSASSVNSVLPEGVYIKNGKKIIIK